MPARSPTTPAERANQGASVASVFAGGRRSARAAPALTRQAEAARTAACVLRDARSPPTTQKTTPAAAAAAERTDQRRGQLQAPQRHAPPAGALTIHPPRGPSISNRRGSSQRNRSLKTCYVTPPSALWIWMGRNPSGWEANQNRIDGTDKGKPLERGGRKAAGLRTPPQGTVELGLPGCRKPPGRTRP